MREKKDFLARVGAYLDLPVEALPGGFSVLLSGDSALCVQGCVSICSYGEEQILLHVGKRLLCVQGKSLFCAELAAGKLLINGTVTGLFFKKEGGDEI